MKDIITLIIYTLLVSLAFILVVMLLGFIYTLNNPGMKGVSFSDLKNAGIVAGVNIALLLFFFLKRYNSKKKSSK